MRYLLPIVAFIFLIATHLSMDGFFKVRVGSRFSTGNVFGHKYVNVLIFNDNAWLLIGWFQTMQHINISHWSTNKEHAQRHMHIQH